MTEQPEYFWRYCDPTYSGGELYLQPVRVVRRTEKGIWVRPFEGGDETEKFINFSWKKQFAHATKEAALDAYKKRKQRQISILAAQHDYAVACLAQAETGKVQTDPFFWSADSNEI